MLQTRNANIEIIDEYLKLKEALGQHGISTQEIGKFLNVLSNVRECDFDSKIIVRKLRSIVLLTPNTIRTYLFHLLSQAQYHYPT